MNKDERNKDERDLGERDLDGGTETMDWQNASTCLQPWHRLGGLTPDPDQKTAFLARRVFRTNTTEPGFA